MSTSTKWMLFISFWIVVAITGAVIVHARRPACSHGLFSAPQKPSFFGCHN